MTMGREESKPKIEELAAKFSRYEKEGKLAGLSESDTKAIFIEPLFEALGWQVRDLEEVSRENTISKGRVDYSFRTSGVVRFFMEAKAADVPLGEKETAQAIDYSYYQSVPWVVLTNFRQLAIYNAEWKEGEQRFLKFDFAEYAARLGELWSLSKESLLNGELDAYAERVGKGKMRDPLTKTLYSDFRKWRGALTRNIAEHSRMNKLTKDQIDEGVQRLLNRLVFIRTCEDRGIENQRLMEAVRAFQIENKRRLTRYMGDITDEFNEVYDSDLFSPHLAGELYLDAEVLQEIVLGLYKYDFSAINADVLGNIYEQYLATVTREGGGLLEKDSKRKEMGIYYTPTYIVDYIVKNTLGELVAKSKTAGDLHKIKVLDPACGSGSFLIRAFGLLNEAYLKKNGGDSQMLGETVSKNANDILTKNIHGVDLDGKAIEIAELNLLLRAAHSRGLLPPLFKNIKRGNSLISGSKEEMEKLFGPHWKEKKHPFNWEEEFKEVMDGGGFDVVIGNPPYIMVENLPEDERKFLMSSLKFAHKRFDIYLGFIEKALSLLKKDAGVLCFIIPFPFLNQDYASKLRREILGNFTVESILDFSETKVFQDAVVKTIVIVIRNKKKPDNSIKIRTMNSSLEVIEKSIVAQQQFLSVPECMIRIDMDEKNSAILNKIDSRAVKLGEIAVVSWGARGVPAEEFHLDRKINEKCKPMIKGKDVKRYSLNYSGKFLLYDLNMLYRPAFKELFENQKLVIQKVTGIQGINATFDEKNYYTDDSLNCLVLKHNVAHLGESFFGKRKIGMTSQDAELSEKVDLKHLLGLINSKLMNFYFKLVLGYKLNVYPESLENLPIRLASPSEQQPIIKLVEQMLDMNRTLVGMGDMKTAERQRLEEEIRRTDTGIDELVYRLYGITGEEKKIIEASFEE